MTPTPEQLNAVADWLAECTVCGKEHEHRRRDRDTMMTWEALDGHSYQKRRVGDSYVSMELITIIRNEARTAKV